MPHPTDVAVGENLRRIRASRKMSQEQLAEHLGVSFQQVQKYEKGTNRISASRMWGMVQALQVPPGEFFEGLAENADEELIAIQPISKQVLRTSVMLTDLEDDDIRRQFCKLGQMIARLGPASNGKSVGGHSDRSSLG